MIVPMSHSKLSLGFTAHLVCVTKPGILVVVVVTEKYP